jgi:hypothetical protein
VLGQFLKFLAHDMSAHPERIRPVSKALMQCIRALYAYLTQRFPLRERSHSNASSLTR